MMVTSKISLDRKDRGERLETLDFLECQDRLEYQEKRDQLDHVVKREIWENQGQMDEMD